MPQTAIIGDVHGLSEPLRVLVAKLAMKAGDHLVFVGDLVDKGPDDIGVIRYIRELHDTAPFDVTIVEGNHDEKHRRYHENLTERPKIAREMASKFNRLERLDAELSREERDFLSSAVPFLRIPDWNVLVVHGGIPANMHVFPESVETARALKGKDRDEFRQTVRMRYVNAETGNFLGLQNETEDAIYWADLYDGRFGHVVFGHQPFMEGPACFAFATGIDTGAVLGGDLTALVLPDVGAPYFTSVAGEPHHEFYPGRKPIYPGADVTISRA